MQISHCACTGRNFVERGEGGGGKGQVVSMYVCRVGSVCVCGREKRGGGEEEGESGLSISVRQLNF